jgi:tetratricopeptide (TPR) repeat protein
MVRIILYIVLFTFGIAYGQKADISILQTKALISQNKFNEALETITSSTPSNKTEIYKLKGYCYFETGRIKQALTYYLKADSISGNSSSLEIAKCYASLLMPQPAAQWLTKHLNSKYKLSEYEIVADTSFAAISHSNEWKNLWKKEWYSPSDIEKSAIKSLIIGGNIKEALTRIDNNRNSIKPTYELNYLEALLYKSLKQWDASLASINMTLESNNRNEQYHLLKSEILKETGNYGESVKSITAAIEINPNEPDYYLKRAEASRLSGNYPLAQTDMELYQKLFPETPETLYQLGMLEYSKGYYLNSLDYFTRLLQKVQTNPVYYAERGNAAYRAERYEIADQDMAAALDIDPNLEKANLIKGKLRLYFSDTEGACFYFEKAAKSGNREATQLLEEKCRK